MTSAQVYAMRVRDMMGKQQEFFRINRESTKRGGQAWHEALREAKAAEKDVRERTRAVLDSQSELSFKET